MKRLALAGILLAALTGSAQAAIVVSNSPTINPNGGNFDWVYTASITGSGEYVENSGAATAGNFFTIYDFFGLIGVPVFVPTVGVASDWVVSTPSFGQNPISTAPIETAVTNITVQYVGATTLNASATLGTLTAVSSVGSRVAGIYASQNGNSGPPNDSTATRTISDTDVPTPDAVPEPGTMALLGGGFLGLALMARRKKTA